MSTPTARHPCPYRPGAPSWYVRATRSALPASRFPAVEYQQLTGEQVAVSVGHSGEDGTAHVTLHIGRHLGKPPRPGPARDTWLRVRADIAARLQQAGFATVPTKAGVRSTPPRPEPVAVHLEHGDVFRDGLDALGRYRIWCPEHPHLAAECSRPGAAGVHLRLRDGEGPPPDLAAGLPHPARRRRCVGRPHGPAPGDGDRDLTAPAPSRPPAGQS